LLEKWFEGAGAPHLAIVGRSGAGKTTLAKHIIAHLLNNTNNVIVLDFDGEYADLPLFEVNPPFPIPRGVSLAWLLSRAARPSREEGGGFGIAGLLGIIDNIDTEDIDEVVTRIKNDLTIPFNIRFAVLWRLYVLKKYFVFTDSHEYNNSSSRYDLSLSDIRERQVVQSILASLVVNYYYSPGPLFLVIEEGVPGEWISDLVALARRRGVRIIYVSQSLPPASLLPSFELVLFTPYVTTQRLQLPLPTDPATDRGVWWVGALGVHRIKY